MCAGREHCTFAAGFNCYLLGLLLPLLRDRNDGSLDFFCILFIKEKVWKFNFRRPVKEP